MGLAASQARLLTITSRMSSVELRQQRIAMDKMRLANDQDGVAEKYTNALNNKTLSISNGSEEVPMTYEALKSHGYQVAKASDVSSISSAKAPTYTTVTTPTVSNTTPTTSTSSIVKPTCPRPEEIQKPSILNGNHWFDEGQRLSLDDDIGFTFNAISISNELSNTNILEYSLGEDFSFVRTPRFQVNTTNDDPNEKNTDYIHTYEMMVSSFNNSVLPQFDKLMSDDSISADVKQRIELTKNVFQQRFEEVVNADYSNAKDAVTALKTVCWQMNFLVNGKTNDEAHNKTMSEKFNYDADWIKAARNTINASATGYTWEQRIAESTWKNEVANAELEWSQYDRNVSKANSTNRTSTSTSTVTSTVSSSSSSYVPSKDFENQLKNSQFLIQGLLSGYLVLMKDGQQVSMSSATDIIESYDKSDDAAAEAEYNAQMAKINRKEKQLDMQAKRLDTEYSALSNEYNSVKSIIDNHTQKDFQYLS